MKIKLLGVMAFLGASFCCAEQLPPGMTMHRMQAGTLDQSGWTKAESSEGAFSVSVPCKFNDFTLVDSDPQSLTPRSFAIGCTTSNDAKFAVTRIQYRDGEAAALRFFNNLSNNVNAPGKALQSGQQRGFKYIDRYVESGSLCALARVVHTPPDNMMLVIQAPQNTCGDLQNEKTKFFESLRVERR